MEISPFKKHGVWCYQPRWWIGTMVSFNLMPSYVLDQANEAEMSFKLTDEPQMDKTMRRTILLQWMTSYIVFSEARYLCQY